MAPKKAAATKAAPKTAAKKGSSQADKSSTAGTTAPVKKYVAEADGTFEMTDYVKCAGG